MRKKSLVSAFAIVIVLSLLLVACSGNTTKTSSVTQSTSSGVAPVDTPATLSMFVGIETSSTTWTVFQQEISNFELQYPDIKVQVTDPGQTNYDTLMTVKMAANDMPDLVETAGWAVALYDKYLVDLRNEPWASEVAPGIKSVVTSSTGKLECLPMDQNVTALIYNVGLLQKYGIDPDTTLKTFDGYMADQKIIHDKSNGTVHTMFIGGGDGWPLGMYWNVFTIPYFISDKNHNYISQLEAGTFNWNLWADFAKKMEVQFTDGYMNPDYATAKFADDLTSLAQEKSVFDWNWSLIQPAEKLNPNLQFSFVPIPTFWPGDVPSLSGGEQNAFGICNTSKNVDDGRLLLDYLARPSNIENLCETEALPAGINGVSVQIGFDTKRLDSFNARVFPVFDRAYLPNGMWNVISQNAGQMSTGAITAQGYADVMKTNYLRLYASAKASS